MIDTSTNKPLQVSAEDIEFPYIMLPESQLEKVTAALDANKVPYWVDEESFSMDDGPFITVINFERGIDPNQIQRLLDTIP